MRVLIGYSRCPHTRAAFERHGHEVYTCDLLPADHPNHLKCDVYEAIAMIRPQLGVFHPMCTYLTVAAAWAYGDGPYHQKVKPETLTGQARRDAREEALENFRRLLGLPFPKAIENPHHSYLHRAVRPSDQWVHPYMFGDDASKRTGFWLDRLPPLLIPPEPSWVAPRIVDGKKRWANQTDSGQNRLSPGPNRWLERSATYPGIADAMGDQWGNPAQMQLAV